MRFVVPVLLLLVAAMGGCGKETGEGSDQAPPDAIVRVGETVLSEGELEYLLPESEKRAFSPSEKAQFVDNWLEVEILYQEAMRRGINRDPRIRARVTALEKEFLADHLMFLEMRNRIRVTEGEIEEYFRENEKRYSYEYRVSHILVNTLEEAEEVKELLKTRGFTWVANRHSIDPVARRGGDLGYLTKGNMIPEFEAVVFDMVPGETSDIIKSDFGYHIIRLVGSREAQVKVSLDDVRESILNNLLMKKREEAHRDFMRQVYESADIEYLKDGYMREEGSEADSLLPTSREE